MVAVYVESLAGKRMTGALKKLIDAARAVRATPEQREKQRRSFAYGNTAFENNLITREMVDRQAEKLATQKPSDERN